MQLADSTGIICAKLNYIVDDGVPPVVYVDWREMEHKAAPPRYEPREVEIHNGRLLGDVLELDTYGFTFTRHSRNMLSAVSTSCSFR